MGVSIESITFSDDSTLEFNDKEIIILVGTNNCGKSATLNNLNQLLDNGDQNKKNKVVKKIEIKKDLNKEVFLKEIEEFRKENGHYSGFGFGFDYGNTINNPYLEGQDTPLGIMASYFVRYSDAISKLSICQPPSVMGIPPFGHIEPESHPILMLNSYKKYRDIFCEIFKKAFGKRIYPHPRPLNYMPLCICDEIPQNENREKDIYELVEEESNLFNSLPVLHEQGDGMKSFSGLLLSLLFGNQSIYLIDEPEAFLHPPQAELAGKQIAELLPNSQVFIATHSRDVIKGILDTCPERVKILRIVRVTNKGKDINKVSLLDKTLIKELWDDPLLKYSNIIDSLFSKKAILCESDSDCKFYSTILNSLNKDKYSDIMFIHCNGKHKMPKIIKALKGIDVDVTVIPDIDIFGEERNLRELIESVGGKFDDVKQDYRILTSQIRDKKSELKREEAKLEINAIIDSENNIALTKEDIKKIRTILDKASSWTLIKNDGENAIPSGDASEAFIKLCGYLSNKGIKVVRIGILENFVKQAGEHGPRWVNNVFEKYPDLNSNVYDKAKNFIRSWDIL